MNCMANISRLVSTGYARLCFSTFSWAQENGFMAVACAIPANSAGSTAPDAMRQSLAAGVARIPQPGTIALAAVVFRAKADVAAASLP